mgnify:CR=1 FL=1
MNSDEIGIHGTIDPNSMDHMNDPILKYVTTDFPRLNETLTVEGALRVIRYQGIGERIVYFYVLDSEERLIGIVPTRRLLTSMPNVRISSIMSTNIVSIPHTAKLMDVLELFVKHKLLAFPVLDDDGRLCGVSSSASCRALPLPPCPLPAPPLPRPPRPEPGGPKPPLSARRRSGRDPGR